MCKYELQKLLYLFITLTEFSIHCNLDTTL